MGMKNAGFKFSDLVELFFVFFKIGAVTFGGGYAMLPMLERELAEKRKWTTKETMLDYYAISGAYGKLGNFVENDFTAYSGGEVTLGKKIGYVMRRIFPPVEFYKEAAPLVYRHRILIPGYCLVRFLRAVFTKPLHLIKQLRLLSRVDKKNGK